jgi:hypothetical protein
MDDVSVRMPTQWDIEQAPCITFGQFRRGAQQREWSLEWLVEQYQGEIDRPTDTVRRVLQGTIVAGQHVSMAEVVLPYRCLIELYQQATTVVPALPGEEACPCGCGAALRGKQVYASDACRKRVIRRAQTMRMAG